MYKQKKRTQNIHKHPCLSGIRTHDLSVGAGEDSSCLRPRGHCDRLLPYAHNSVREYSLFFGTHFNFISKRPVYKVFGLCTKSLVFPFCGRRMSLGNGRNLRNTGEMSTGRVPLSTTLSIFRPTSRHRLSFGGERPNLPCLHIPWKPDLGDLLPWGGGVTATLSKW
jgi:hypothetical protein